MLKFEYTFYLPKYVADNHGHPTGFVNLEALSRFLNALGDICGGYNIVSSDAYGVWHQDDLIIRDNNYIVNCTMTRDVFENSIVSHLREFKLTMNQLAVYVTATQVEVCCV